MADPKYAGLPGIAYDQEDVYETTDLPEAEQFPVVPEEENDSIEKLHISATEAFGKFKGKHLIGKGIDFSDKIARKQKTGYQACGEWELPGEDEKETPVQKYQRLQCEIKELFEEITSIKEKAKNEEDTKSFVEMITEVEQAGKELNSLNPEETLGKNILAALSDPRSARVEQLVSEIESFKLAGVADKRDEAKKPPGKEPIPTDNVLKYQMNYLPEKARLQEVARIAQLERRLGKLENLVGTSDDKLAKFSQSLKSQGILESVQQLGAKSALLDSNQLEAIESRLSALLHRMDSIAQKKSLIAQDSDRDKKIAEMYEIMKKTEGMSPLLVQTLNRMIALNAVHQQAAEFTKSLQQLEELQGQITSSLDGNKSMLKGVQESFATNLETVKKSITNLDERVKKLGK